MPMTETKTLGCQSSQTLVFLSQNRRLPEVLMELCFIPDRLWWLLIFSGFSRWKKKKICRLWQWLWPSWQAPLSLWGHRSCIWVGRFRLIQCLARSLLSHFIKLAVNKLTRLAVSCGGIMLGNKPREQLREGFLKYCFFSEMCFSGFFALTSMTHRAHTKQNRKMESYLRAKQVRNHSSRFSKLY